MLCPLQLLLSFSLCLSILQPDMGKKSKYKTSVKKKTLNPEFNEVQLASCSTNSHQTPANLISLPSSKLCMAIMNAF